MDDKIRTIARTGYVSKGIVYALTGMLAIGAAVGLGHTSEGKLGVLKFLEEQPFGKVLLGILGMGLLCYSYWRFFQSIKDPEDIGSDTKALGTRIGFFFSGIIYLGLGIYSFYQIFKSSSGGKISGGSMLPTASLEYIFYAVAIGLAIKAIFHLNKAYQGKFLKKFKLDGFSNIHTGKTIRWLGYAGMGSRAIVVGIVAYIFFKAAGTATQGDIKGTEDAFSFLRQNSEGRWLLCLIALGLICYGAYMFIKAKYRRFEA